MQVLNREHVAAADGAAPKVAVVLLNYNAAGLTRDCVNSLMGQDVAARLYVLIVDNGSDAQTREELSTLCRETGAETFFSPANLGFAGGVNLGIRRILAESPPDFFWLLNNDTVCDPDALARLLAAFSSGGRVAASGCMMREESDSIVPAGSNARAPFFVPRRPPPGTVPDYLCGACLLISRQAIEEIGLLDPAFFFYFEDADWGLRARAAGWELAVSDGVPIFHAGGGTVRKNSFFRAREYRRAYAVFLRKHARRPLPALVLTAIWRIASDALRLDFAAVRGTLAGLFPAK